MWQCLRTETSARGAFFELGREYCTNPLEATRDALTVFVSISKEVDDLFFRKDGAVKAPSAYDRFIGSDKGLQDKDPSISLPPSRSNRIDPMLDEAEWEIPWEDLVIGDKIGLGNSSNPLLSFIICKM
ncbi:uncharacterized protein LOC114581182 isoform X2 [Dendrobium catenatum]|uniref:uncharacterized protein LOC114581182 isoform X2 n=1 Tax=Dendrobium catenatum TaxID=906689 RepID=UPI00109F1F32|nr:uncharacterized protein LOC114581182 isoform X2 [Dendrobium catenatum]